MSKDGGCGDLAKIIVFLLRMAFWFWRIEMGYHFLKNLPTCCFTMKVSHYRCAIHRRNAALQSVQAAITEQVPRFASLAMPCLAKATVHG